MMPETNYCGRQAAFIENSDLRVTVLKEGGHIAEILDKRSGVNPLWIPPWPSIEPSTYDSQKHAAYGTSSDARLLAGIMGHNLCLDIFGGPSNEEFAAGLTPHGEGSVVPYEIRGKDGQLRMRAHLRLAQIEFQRQIELIDGMVRITERAESRCAFDRPIGWTQHVTLGPPFLDKSVTQFRASASRSKVYESEFGSASYLKTGAEFEWPMAPRSDGGPPADLQILNNTPVSSGYTAHLMDPRQEDAFFVTFSPAFRLAFGYVWKRADFPWLGIWEENHSRTNPPWNGKTLARGMEFGVSPMPESRCQMTDRGRLFDVPTYRWLRAKSQIEVEYYAIVRNTDSIPNSVDWPQLGKK
jgi:hypothetical protein